MNMKRAHSNYIAENQAIIAELTRRLADRDEVQKQQHKELLAHQDLQLSQSKEISRLKALCQEPVVLTLADVDIPETLHEYDAVVQALTALIDRVRATAIESYFAPKTAFKSFAEVHPPAIGADCKCEHWQACNVCHPTYEAKHENN